MYTIDYFHIVNKYSNINWHSVFVLVWLDLALIPKIQTFILFFQSITQKIQNLSIKSIVKPQTFNKTDVATHAIPARKMSTQGKTDRKKILKIKII